ncbi:glycosyltransferase family 4 protein [Parabacteroides faecis]|uniref:glycosyltransferase family 4 protein n=1 Tax=Parabacteroides faecis TaxID=1217282 RepID=UPI003521C870
MRLLYIHQYFNFPEDSGGTRSYDLAKSFANRGIRVIIITSNTELGSCQNQKERWKKVVRDDLILYVLRCRYDNNMNFRQRIASFFSFAFYSSLKVIRIKADLVLATSTPLTIGVPALIKKIFQKTPYVFEVRDVWPEVPIKMGIIKNKLLINMLRLFEKVVYRHASWIVPLSTGMSRNIVARVKNVEDKITVIPNISELDRFSNLTPTVSFPFSLDRKKILLYCGTIGKVNGLQYLVDLASKTIKYDKNIIYCIFGKGNELDIVLQKAQAVNILNRNFFYLGVVSKTDLPYLYHVASTGSSFVIDNPILWDNSANKFFDTLAARKPIVINHEGWQAEVIRRYECGYVLPSQLTDNSVTDFISFIMNDDKMEQMGENAYKLAKQEFSLEVATDKYMQVFNSIITL